MVKALVALLLATAPALAEPLADPELVTTARLCVSNFYLNNPRADNQVTGTGLTFAAQLGLRYERVEPSVAIEIGQFTGSDVEGFQPTRDLRERMVNVTARVRYSFTDFLDVTAGLGGAITFEHEKTANRYSGYHYEAAAGLRIWHRHHQAVRVEGSIANSRFSVPGPNGVDFSILQIGASLGYSRTF